MNSGSQPSRLRVLLFGRGVIASLYGWALAQAGHDVEFYVRPGRAAAYGDAIDLDLLDTRRRPWGRRVAQRWPVRYREELDRDYDLIVLSVQHYRLTEAAKLLAPHIGNATVLIFGNFFTAPRDAIGPLPAGQIAWGAPQGGGSFGKDGVLHGVLLPSVVLGAAGEPTGRERAVRRVFREAGFRVNEQSDFRGWMWLHFVSNAGLHSRALRSGALADLAGSTRDLREALLAGRELLPVLEARGVDLRRHRAGVLPYRAPAWLTAAVMSWLIKHFAPARMAFEAHDDPAAREPREVCRDALAEARRLGVAVPRLEAAEPLFAREPETLA